MILVAITAGAKHLATKVFWYYFCINENLFVDFMPVQYKRFVASLGSFLIVGNVSFYGVEPALLVLAISTYIHSFISLFKVDKNHNSLLTNKGGLTLKRKKYNHISYIYPELAIKLLQRKHRQSSQLHNFMLALKISSDGDICLIRNLKLNCFEKIWYISYQSSYQMKYIQYVYIFVTFLDSRK